MVNNKKYNSNYTYGNNAYKIIPEIEENEQLKNKKKPRNYNKLNLKLKFMSAVAIIFILSLITLSRFATIVKLTYDIRSLKADAKQIQTKTENTNVEIAKYNNIKSIENAAINKYGMVIPLKDQIAYLDVKPLTKNSIEELKPTAFKNVKKFLGFLY